MRVVIGTADGTTKGIASAFFCVSDRDLFLKAPINVQIKEGETVVWNGDVVRLGCLWSESKTGTYLEYNRVLLNADGTIAGEFGTDAGTYSTCQDVPMDCPEDSSDVLENQPTAGG